MNDFAESVGDYVRVRIHPNRKVELSHPRSSARPPVYGPGLLYGRVSEVEGVRWVFFPTQRNFGLPLRERDVGDSIDYALDSTCAFGDISYEISSRPFFEETS